MFVALFLLSCQGILSEGATGKNEELGLEVMGLPGMSVHVDSIHLGPKGELCLSDRIREKEEEACWREVLEECLQNILSTLLWTTILQVHLGLRVFLLPVLCP